MMLVRRALAAPLLVLLRLDDLLHPPAPVARPVMASLRLPERRVVERSDRRKAQR